jgi:hypothetical protein
VKKRIRLLKEWERVIKLTRRPDRFSLEAFPCERLSVKPVRSEMYCEENTKVIERKGMPSSYIIDSTDVPLTQTHRGLP